MDVYTKIVNRESKISLIGLGYVGLPIAIAFAKKVSVVGFDVNRTKIDQYLAGIDSTKEVGNAAVQSSSVEFTSDPTRLKEANFHIVAVPTPVNSDKTPDLRPVESASHLLGKQIKKGDIIVYESTVYPGVTEEICVPILELESGLSCGQDFKVGYSPERINPGDQEHRLETIIKVVSGMDEEALDEIAKVYSLVIQAGVYRASSIKVAEAAKVIENAQRDINIAFMNELSIIFHRMGIDTREVLNAAGTKWNFLRFIPGLVGGHCIGVDPYYLTYKAEQLGYHSQIISAGRRINDGMGKYVAESLVKSLIRSDIPVKSSSVALLGFTFKENVPDTRNTKAIDIVKELQEYGINPVVVDPVADAAEAFHEYGMKFEQLESLHDLDAIIIVVGHSVFSHFDSTTFTSLFNKGHASKIIFDLKGLYNRTEFESAGFDYWRL